MANPEVKKLTYRVSGHIDALQRAGLDTQAFFDALVGIRDDTALTEPQRTALYKLVAGECFLWYLEALKGAPIDRVALAVEAHKLAEENNVAIKRRTPGDMATALFERALSAKKK